MFRLVALVEPIDETDPPATVEDRWFGTLVECMDRICNPHVTERTFAIYQRDSEGWLLYFHSI
jgi:hypothetical protein